jgi:hypothetical protein
MKDFTNYRAAAAFARLRARQSQQVAKLERHGSRWLVGSAQELSAANDAAIQAETLATGRERIRQEIEETRQWLAELGGVRGQLGDTVRGQ